MESRPPEPGPDDTGRDPDLQELAEAYARTGHPRLREMVVLCCQDWSRGLARGVARGSAAEPDDLSQVAALAVMRALDRYDPAIGPLEPYARATVAGEVGHYLRATEWPLRVPRRYQEAYRRLARARDDLGKGAAGCPLEQLGKVAGIPEGDLEPVGALRRRTESLERGAETGQIDGWLPRIDGGMESVPERTDLRRASKGSVTGTGSCSTSTTTGTAPSGRWRGHSARTRSGSPAC